MQSAVAFIIRREVGVVMGTGNVPKSVTVYLESIPVLCRQQSLALREALGFTCGYLWMQINVSCCSCHGFVLLHCSGGWCWGVVGSANLRGCCLFMLDLNSPCEERGQ